MRHCKQQRISHTLFVHSSIDVPAYRTQRLEVLLTDYPTPDATKWQPEPTTRSYLRRFGEQSGVYILRHHSAYCQQTNDVYKVGRTGCLTKRFQDYRGVMSIVGFVATPWPRVVEMLILKTLGRFVIHGYETVRLPLNALNEVFMVAARDVEQYWMPRFREFLDVTDVYHKGSDRMLRDLVKSILPPRVVKRVKHGRFLGAIS